MKRFVVFLAVVLLLLATASTVSAKGDKCTTIQSGTLLASDNIVIGTGYDQWGYNYQGHMFNGYYCDA